MTIEEALALRSRVVSLHPITTEDAAKDFGGDPDRVPKRALTMGVATICSAWTKSVISPETYLNPPSRGVSSRRVRT